MAQQTMVLFKNTRTGLEFGMFENKSNMDNIMRMRKDPESEELEPTLTKTEEPKEAKEDAQPENVIIDDMPVKDLKEMAKTLGLEGYSNLKRNDLVELIKNNIE